MKRIDINHIVFDAGTQIRQAINEEVVSEYAERMAEGVQFPPIVVFSDGSCLEDGTPIYFLADGFHRAHAAKRNDFKDIDAIVHVGTQQDALWFALGANKANGQRLTAADKKHAIVLALKTWPDRSINQIAEQIGVNQRYASGIRAEVSATTNLPSRVTGKDGKSYPASRPKVETSKRHPKHDEIVAAVEAGGRVHDIAQSLHVSPRVVSAIKHERGLIGIDKSREATAARRERMRQMAADGYTSIQIAESLGLSIEGCRAALKDADIEVFADKATRHMHRLDSIRIMEHIVLDAEHLTADVGLIDFSDFTPAQIATWLQSLKASRDKLNAFIRRLTQEVQNRGEAA